jgi:hypothetical protein
MSVSAPLKKLARNLPFLEGILPNVFQRTPATTPTIDPATIYNQVPKTVHFYRRPACYGVLC